MIHTVSQRTAVDEIEADLVLPAFNPADSIFRKLANKESFSPDEVWKVVTAIEKKEASKKMIENFTANLQKMAEEAKLKEEIKRIDPPVKAGKNAYEIRDSILDKAVETVKLSTDTSGLNSTQIADRILLIADKFYEFVENKRGKSFK
jgi:hypothetical protein